jgi:phosphoglycolate phosphatase
VKPTVLLFDVDGTLVTTCGAGRRAIERAFELRHGTKEIVNFSFGGMTDKAIVRDALTALGRRSRPKPTWSAPSTTCWLLP